MSVLTGHYALVITSCVLICQEHTDVHAEMVIIMLVDYVKVTNTLFIMYVGGYWCVCICMHVCEQTYLCKLCIHVCVCIYVCISYMCLMHAFNYIYACMLK